MGCCGCSLYASTITAGVLTLLDCVLLLTFDVLILCFYATKNVSMKDKQLEHYIQGFHNLDATVIALIGIKTGIRVIWCLSAIVLFIGNAKEYRKFLYIWQYLTVSRIIFSIATSIYAIVSFKKFNNLSDHGAWQDGPLMAEFTILVDFLELGPIWTIILIALVIYVQRRGQEINKKKMQMSQVNQWGNFDYNQSNGNTRNTFSALAHPVSLTQEPNPFNGAKEEVTRELSTVLKPSAGQPVEPILQINDVICIPRAQLNPTKEPSIKFNVLAVDDKPYENRKSNSSALAQRTSYLEYERDPNKAPKRNNSYNIAQTSGQRAKNYYSYDNRGFQKSDNELNLYKPVLIKRASVKK